ncbi:MULTISPECIES: hypothetical protein [unclassified Bradyrhizobium]|nr:MULTISPECIES: hypothetical protein [unclassified Bradyrhizobium]
MSDHLAIGLADIERTIVDYLDTAGFDVGLGNDEWIAQIGDSELHVTALAVAIHGALRACRIPPAPTECPSCGCVDRHTSGCQAERSDG